MKDAYQTWIRDYLESIGTNGAYGMCGAATKAMALTFPELRLARGYVYDAAWGRRTHWWCVAPDGEVIDPTVSQFPAFAGDYQELLNGDPIPSGVCADCGETVYDGASFCNSTCESRTVEYLNGARP